MATKTIAILSGGMDSATMVAYLLNAGHEVKCLTVDYGQRHRAEIACAVHLCAHWAIEHRIVDLKCIRELIGNSALSGDVAVPHGHYEEESMKLTVVPNRNMIMLAIAVGWAVNLKFDTVAYGAHCGDHAIYPDCRPEFVDKLNAATQLADWHTVKIAAPFLGMTKGDIAALGVKLGVPFALTHTCYEGERPPCGKCGACQERAEAFAFAGAKDPLL